MDKSDSPLFASGGYKKLRSYKVAQVVYDATVVFCDRFIDTLVPMIKWFKQRAAVSAISARAVELPQLRRGVSLCSRMSQKPV